MLSRERFPANHHFRTAPAAEFAFLGVNGVNRDAAAA
jgi:hypothetical protein